MRESVPMRGLTQRLMLAFGTIAERHCIDLEPFLCCILQS